MLQYLVGDYPEAVDDSGRVFDSNEYKEHRQMLSEIDDILRRAPSAKQGGVLAELTRLRKSVDQHRPPGEVAPRLRRLHARIVKTYQVRLAPEQVPSLPAGRILFQQACVICHGANGSGDTPQARQQTPRPRDFRARELAEVLSPYAAFTMITFGVPGTSMASFETLSEEERWSLAFYVLALRHGMGDGAAANRTAPDFISQRITVAELAAATDGDLARRLAGLTEPARRAQIVYWRHHLPLEIAD
jgi:high-affinity iron transporter